MKFCVGIFSFWCCIELLICIMLPASNLPSDDGEFYQFCYMTSKGQVHGLSSPFQFRKSISFSSLDDLIEIEDENGELLIIKSKSAYLDEQLKKANEKFSLLNQVFQAVLLSTIIVDVYEDILLNESSDISLAFL